MTCQRCCHRWRDHLQVYSLRPTPSTAGNIAMTNVKLSRPPSIQVFSLSLSDYTITSASVPYVSLIMYHVLFKFSSSTYFWTIHENPSSNWREQNVEEDLSIKVILNIMMTIILGRLGCMQCTAPGGEDTPCRTVKCAKVHCQAFQCTALAGSRVSVNLKYLQNQYIPSTVLYLCLYHTCTVFVWYVLGVQCGCHKNMPSNHGPSRPCRVTTVGTGQGGDVRNVEINWELTNHHWQTTHSAGHDKFMLCHNICTRAKSLAPFSHAFPLLSPLLGLSWTLQIIKKYNVTIIILIAQVHIRICSKSLNDKEIYLFETVHCATWEAEAKKCGKVNDAKSCLIRLPE